MVVTPVPEVRDLIWDNMHVSRALINTRKAWANLVLTGGLGTYTSYDATIKFQTQHSGIVHSHRLSQYM